MRQAQYFFAPSSILFQRSHKVPMQTVCEVNEDVEMWESNMSYGQNSQGKCMKF